ncbi:plasmid stabilization protein [Phyllobacterium sp. TAF24]|uniref:FitA-like ribbon-helix-helix domain-containing protein n=1 Tax=Phyllobacterium sp. TAF24 TaxID=3233068 RepID=UPI003F9CAADF
MASMTIRNLEDQLKTRLRIQAAQHGKSMEDEARDILRAALSREPFAPVNLADAIHGRFKAWGGVDLPIAPREAARNPVDFSE